MKRSFPLLFAALLLVTVLIGALSSGRRAQPEPLPIVQKVVLLIVPGLSLHDLHTPADDNTPTLNGLASGRFPIGVMPTKRGPGGDALADALSMIACGRRSPEPDVPCLGRVLTEAHTRTVLLTDLETAQPLVRADTMPSWEVPWRVPDRDAPDGYSTDPAILAHTIKIRTIADPTSPAFVVALFDGLYRADQYAPLALPQVTARNQQNALHRLDKLITYLTGPTGLPEKTALLIVSPLATREAELGGERLGPLVLWTRPENGAPLRQQLLSSPSTRGTPGLIAATDMAATIAALLGVLESQRHIGDGRAAFFVTGTSDSLYRRVDGWIAQTLEQRLLVTVPWVLAAILIGATALLRSGRTRIAGALAVGVATVPLALWIAPLLLPPSVPLSLYATVTVLATIAAGCSLRLPARSALLAVGLGTVCVAILDLVLGGAFGGLPLLSRSPLSYSVAEAARYYGLGNEASGVLLGAALCAAPVFGSSGIVGVLLWGMTVLLAAILPSLGADAGSLLAEVSGFGTLIAFSVDARRRVATALAVVAVAAVLLIGFVAWEGSRTERQRTHVGEAISQVRSHGPQAALLLGKRKVLVNLRLLGTSPWAALFFVEVGLLVYLLRCGRVPRSAIDNRVVLAQCVGAGVIFLTNDSGVVAGATCLLYAVANLLTHAE